MDVDFLLRMKGVLDASMSESKPLSGQAQAESYLRIRGEVASSLGEDTSLRAEVERLFPSELSSSGRPWGVQGAEAVVLMSQLAGWLSGLIEASILDRRIRAEAEERAKRTGFG